MAILNFLSSVLLLNLIQNAYSVPISSRSSRSNWVFWYYANNGQTRSCANYCILTFSLVGGIILLLMLCGCWSCYRIKKRSEKEGRAHSYSSYYKEFFHSQGSLRKTRHEKSNTSESMSELKN